MKWLISCVFYMDTACVVLKFSDNSMIAIAPSLQKMKWRIPSRNNNKSNPFTEKMEKTAR